MSTYPQSLSGTSLRSPLEENDIVVLIKAFAKARSWEVTYASRVASGSGDTVDRLEGGIGMTLRRARAVIQKVSDEWPEGDVSWPSNIPRPSETPEDRAAVHGLPELTDPVNCPSALPPSLSGPTNFSEGYTWPSEPFFTRISNSWVGDLIGCICLFGCFILGLFVAWGLS